MTENEQLTTYDKVHIAATFLGLFGLFMHFFALGTIFPHLAIKKAERGEFKETCAYVVERRKVKYSHEYIIVVDGEHYTHFDIFPMRDEPMFKKEVWNNFPIISKRFFLSVEPNTCKKVQYIDAFNKFGYKQIYLYDYLDQP